MHESRVLPFTVSTRTGIFRHAELSEDRLAVHHVPDGVVVVVADGAGGIAGGRPAADLVLSVVAEAIAQPGFNPFSPAAWTHPTPSSFVTAWQERRPASSSP